VTAEDGAAVVDAPAVDDAPGEFRTVKASDAEVVKVAEDGLVADEGAVMSWQLGAESEVDGSLAGGRETRVIGTFASEVTTAWHGASRWGRRWSGQRQAQRRRSTMPARSFMDGKRPGPRRQGECWAFQASLP
jgi:hypothetical protein